MLRMTVTVRGRVQMVGYRMFAEMAADRIGGIQGSVRNLSDGSSVEVIAEGSREALEALLGELKIGPSMAIVRELDIEWSNSSGEFDAFGTIF